tara:strand:- start:749 stop:1069 length:321 start_codon:yes stop_codon:yes gene_type:complete
MVNKISILELTVMMNKLSKVFQNDNEQINELDFEDKKTRGFKFKKSTYGNYKYLYFSLANLDYLESFQTIEIFGDIKIIRKYEKRYQKMDNIGEFYLAEEKKKFPS